MDYEGFFRERLDALRGEGRYRVFADLERRCGRFPRAFDHRIGAEVTVSCSKDYLGMGQHPAVLAAVEETLRAVPPAPAGPATSRATVICISCSSASSPICTAARRR
jgi:5-aminolevulinate synthase